MGSYKPLHITGPTTGLVRQRENFLIPDDAYPTLQNAYVWRERIKRKKGCQLLGRLQRNFSSISMVNSSASPWTISTIFTKQSPSFTPESTASVVPGSVVITVGGIVFTDQGDGTLTSPTPGNSGTINYSTAIAVLTHTAGAGAATTMTYSYYPGLPVMGIKRADKIIK